MDDDDEILATIYLLLLIKKRQEVSKKRKKRRWSVRHINLNRNNIGQYVLFKQMKLIDSDNFFVYTRMSVQHFDYILNLLKPHLTKQSSRESLTPEFRLALTLHYLSQGISMQSAARAYCVDKTTVHFIIKETCQALWEVLSPIYVKAPEYEEDWLSIARGFETQWNFPHCIGALDAKHIRIQAPKKSASQYLNYKKSFSIVLMAACDANYSFTTLDIGAYGSASDGGVFKQSIFKSALVNNEMNVPQSASLPGTNLLMPYFLVADEAFPLKDYAMLQPYPGTDLSYEKKVFNYRLSRARRTIENAFGILSSRWRILSNNIADVNTVEGIVKATVCLHNFLRNVESSLSPSDRKYCPLGYDDSDDNRTGLWRQDDTALQSVGRLSANNAKRDMYDLRNNLAQYFTSPAGEVPWQNHYVNNE